jgi:hypothetical protein
VLTTRKDADDVHCAAQSNSLTTLRQLQRWRRRDRLSQPMKVLEDEKQNDSHWVGLERNFRCRPGVKPQPRPAAIDCRAVVSSSRTKSAELAPHPFSKTPLGLSKYAAPCGVAHLTIMFYTQTGWRLGGLRQSSFLVWLRSKSDTYWQMAGTAYVPDEVAARRKWADGMSRFISRFF